MGIFFNRTPREPRMSDHAVATRRGIIARALGAGRDVDSDGYSLERKHRAQRRDGWFPGGEQDRNSGEDVTRRRAR